MNQSRLDRLTSTFDAGALICTLSCRVDGREYYFTLRDPGHAYTSTRIFLSESVARSTFTIGADFFNAVVDNAFVVSRGGFPFLNERKKK